MEMRRGFKHTEVGPIPEEWECTTLSEKADLLTGFPFPSSGYSASGVRLLRGSNVKRGTIDWSDDLVKFWPAVTSETVKYALQSGDIVVAMDGALVGRSFASLDESDTPSLLLQRVARIRAHGYSQRYIKEWVCSERFGDHCDSVKTNTAIPHISSGDIRAFKIAFPPTFSEQEAIAEALSDVDALIKSLEKLLAKKSQIKQGAIQGLLTGKKRLPGFNGKWENKKLGTLGSFLKGSGVKKDQTMSGSLPCIRYGEIYTRHHDLAREFYSWISPDVAATATRIRKGDLLFAGSGETKEEIGKCVAISADVEAYAGGDIVILRTQDNDEVFLGYYLNTTEIKQQKASRGQGDAVVHISSAALADIDCYLPRPLEQRAIGQALFDMDNELTFLEAKLTKARQIKQGMMQELLTGRIRLVSPNSALVSLSDYRRTKFTAGTTHNRQIEEAVMLGVLSMLFGTEQYPLARVRRTKLLYLLQCYLDQPTDAYLKKAAGPYNPGTRYKGPEGIAVRNGYVRIHHNGAYEGFVAGDKAAHARAYFEKWHGEEAVSWLERLRFKKTEELELLATVHMAAQELRKQGKVVEANTVCTLIASEPEWLPKLDRALFAKGSIAAAIVESRVLFGD